MVIVLSSSPETVTIPVLSHSVKQKRVKVAIKMLLKAKKTVLNKADSLYNKDRRKEE
jgi:hypothetical protein